MERPQISVTRISDYDMCPQYEHWKWREGLADSRDAISAPLGLGTAMHDAFASILTNQPWVRMVDRPDVVELDHIGAQVVDMALELWEVKYASAPPWTEILQVEHPLRIEFTHFDLVGKPDAAVRGLGKQLWHLQHKSLGASRPVGTYVMGQAISNHEQLYCEMLEAEFGEPVGGTMLNLVRKLSLKRAKENPHQLLHMEFLPIPKQRRVAGVKALERRATEMLNVDVPYRNRAACTGKYGNSPCAFYKLCWGDAEVKDFVKADPMAYYKDAEPDVGTD